MSLLFADSTIIEVIATAKIIAAIVPNSGTTCVPIISIVYILASNGTVTVLPSCDASSLSSSLIKTKNVPSLNGVMTSVGSVIVN